MTGSPILAEALAMAARGLPVFPCGPDKAPACKRGFYDATTNPAAIRRLFGRSFALMIGTPTGELTGFDAVDIDYTHRGDLWEAENRHRLPPTRIHQTQNGGRHYLFRHHPGMRNSAGRIGLGVDVRGDGGYLILPPSPGYGVLLEADLAPWPAWLVEAATPIPYVSPAAAVERPDSQGRDEDAYRKRLSRYIEGSLRNLAATPDGTKHEKLLRVARSLGSIAAEAGESDETLINQMMAALADRDVKDAKAAVRTARDGLAFGRKRPNRLQEKPYAGARS